MRPHLQGEGQTDRSRGRTSLTSREDRQTGLGHGMASPPGRRTGRQTGLGVGAASPPGGRTDTQVWGRTSLTSRESPEMTSAQSCFLRKAFSSRWASPRLVTSTKGSMGFFRQEYWNEFPCPSPGDLPNSGIEPVSPALQVDSLLLSHQVISYNYQYMTRI